MTIEQIDVDYVRSVGEEIRARLFPVPKADGRVPFPLPVGVNYQPVDGAVGDEVLFVPLRAIQWVGKESLAVDESQIYVIWSGTDYLISFTFGEKPEVPEALQDDAMASRLALIYAVAGVL